MRVMCTGKATGAEAAVEPGQQDGSHAAAREPKEEKDAGQAALREQLRALVPEGLPAMEEHAHAAELAAELAAEGGAPVAAGGAASTAEQQVHHPVCGSHSAETRMSCCSAFIPAVDAGDIQSKCSELLHGCRHSAALVWSAAAAQGLSYLHKAC